MFKMAVVLTNGSKAVFDMLYEFVGQGV